MSDPWFMINNINDFKQIPTYLPAYLPTYLHVYIHTYIHLNFPLFEITGWGTSIGILECQLKPPVNLHTKPHVGQVCFVGLATSSRASSQTACMLRLAFQVIYQTCLWQEETSAHATLLLMQDTRHSTIILHAEYMLQIMQRAPSAFVLNCYLSLTSFLQDARFSVNAPQLSTSISSFLKLLFKTSLNYFLALSL